MSMDEHVFGIPVVKAALRPHPVTTIIKAAAKYFKKEEFMICCKRRNGPLIRARHVAMYLACEMTITSTPEIGRRFGGRDHSSVWHAHHKIWGLLSGDPALAADVEAVRQLALKMDPMLAGGQE